MTAAYPLSWPQLFPRAKTREAAKFKTTLPRAIENVRKSLRLFGSDSGKAISNLVISSNYSLTSANPADPGVSVWFTWDGLQVCIPVDRYTRIEHNLQAIHQVIEARRVELRHGTLALVRATFTGFAALPAPTPARPWREVLDLPHGPVAMDAVESAYKRLAMKRHPDNGGSHDAMSELNGAMAAARKELSHG